MFTIEEISLENKNNVAEIKDFLNKFNLNYDNDIDYSIVVYDNGNIIGTASKAFNVLKCFAIDESYQGLGIVNNLVKKIEDRMFKEGIYHFFIYTKSCNLEKFKNIGYSEIITSENISILENGIVKINKYLDNLKIKHNISNTPKACIVVNGNPFTLGHRHLIETASNENNEVLVLVVSEDKSTFPFSIRYKLICDGVKDLKNVKVIETGPYLVSNASFPTYFIKNKSEIVNIHAIIDCEIFLKYYKTIFNINKRYVGEEPYCDVTRTYNQTMRYILPRNNVEVNEIKRYAKNNDIISASKIRLLLKEKKFEEIKALVPDTTYNFLISDEAKLIIKKINKERH